MHGIVAAWTKIDALEINEADGKLLANASKAIFDHYNYTPTVLKGPWAKVFSALGQVYGGKIFAAVMEAKMKAASAPPAPSSPIQPNNPKPGTVHVPGVGDFPEDITGFQGGPQL